MAVTPIGIAGLLITEQSKKPATAGNETGTERDFVPVSFAVELDYVSIGQLIFQNIVRMSRFCQLT